MICGRLPAEGTGDLQPSELADVPSLLSNMQDRSGSRRAKGALCITRADPFLRLHRVVELDAGIPAAGSVGAGWS